ncbi:hypothetical protein GGF43_000791 [Coemansia sp. RSA 2618]|nr:hypothetical protein GGF43_000791 [Coemansia sp. RSA 2618]
MTAAPDDPSDSPRPPYRTAGPTAPFVVPPLPPGAATPNRSDGPHAPGNPEPPHRVNLEPNAGGVSGPYEPPVTPGMQYPPHMYAVNTPCNAPKQQTGLQGPAFMMYSTEVYQYCMSDGHLNPVARCRQFIYFFPEYYRALKFLPQVLDGNLRELWRKLLYLARIIRKKPNGRAILRELYQAPCIRGQEVTRVIEAHRALNNIVLEDYRKIQMLIELVPSGYREQCRAACAGVMGFNAAAEAVTAKLVKAVDIYEQNREDILGLCEDTAGC